MQNRIARTRSLVHLSPPRGERSSREARRVRGRRRESERCDKFERTRLSNTNDSQAAATPPHPNPLPARGERETQARAPPPRCCRSAGPPPLPAPLRFGGG